MEQKVPKPRINPEYRRMYQPISETDYAALEKELLSQNVTVVIKVWSNNILYDFEKYEICQKHHIPYKTSRLYARNTIEALLWLCKAQLERTDLALEMRKYLIGKRFLYEKMLGAHILSIRRAANSSKEKPKMNEPRYEYCAMKTRERLAEEYNVVHMTIWKYGIYAEALDAIYDISEVLATSIMQGRIKISQENVVAISKLPEKEIQNMANHLLYENADLSTYTSSRKVMEKVKPEPEKEVIVEKTVSIKDMPAYDPDAEFASLTLTIPSWISSIKRAINASDINKVSMKSKDRLRIELEKLCDVIFEVFDVLKEE